MTFDRRVGALPFLGIGVSTEYGAMLAPGSLDVRRLRAERPEFAAFLEVGVETAKGLDEASAAWAAAGGPTTYHFLDVNLDEPDDLDDAWLAEVGAIAAQIRPAWLCGDAGAWHFGPREAAQMLLLPPVLTDDAATAMAEGIVALREATGLEVLPENPPGAVFVGDLHLLDFFARVCERADTGMLLDCVHLAIYQHATGGEPTTGLDGFDLARVVEIHVAGGERRSYDGFDVIDDAHTLSVLPETWAILDRVAPAATELRAVVLECERNPFEVVVPGYEALERRLADSPFGARRA